MKMIGFKMFVIALLGMTSLVASAQNDLTVKVTNLRSKQGKVLLATRTGQYAMESVKGDTVVIKLTNVPEGDCTLMAFQDDNGNYQLDEENNVPIENCVIKEIKVKKGENEIVILALEDFRNKVRK